MKMWPVIVSAKEQILALTQALAERDEALRVKTTWTTTRMRPVSNG